MKRVENWNRSVSYVINPINHQESTLESMQSLQNEACFIPVIVSANRKRNHEIVSFERQVRLYCERPSKDSLLLQSIL